MFLLVQSSANKQQLGNNEITSIDYYPKIKKIQLHHYTEKYHKKEAIQGSKIDHKF